MRQLIDFTKNFISVWENCDDDSTPALVEQWHKFTTDNNLPLMSADDLLITYLSIEVDNIVEYKEPYADEIGTTYAVVEIDHTQNYVLMRALVDMKIQPTYVAKITEIIKAK